MTGAQVLQVTLDTGAESPVRMRLLTDDGSRGWSEPWSVSLSAESLGLPHALDGGPCPDSRFRLPSLVHEQLPEHLATAAEVTWLQLREPFGYLGLVPWEALLARTVPGPIVRLATIDLGARAPSDDLVVAVLAIAPDPDRPGEARERLHGARVGATTWWRERGRAGTNAAATRRPVLGWAHEPGPPRLTSHGVEALITAIQLGSPRRTTVHVVATPWILAELRGRWPESHPSVRLHAPGASPRDAGRSTRPDANEWFRQTVAALDGEQADVVHVVCRAVAVGPKLRLAFADPPDRAGAGSSRFVSLAALRTFLESVGAWSVHLTSPPGDPAAAVLRLAACKLTEARPGPVVFTDLGVDPGASDVRAAYGFVCRRDPGRPPRRPGAVISCEPHRVRGGAGAAGGPHTSVEAAAATRPTGALSALIRDEDTPGWVAATQRFIEQRHLELARLQRDAPIGSTSPEGRHAAQGVEEAIAALTEVVDRWAADRGRVP